MKNMTVNFLFIRALLVHLDRIEELLGHEWPYFQKNLLELLENLLKSKDDNEAALRVDEIFNQGLMSRAGELVRALLRQAIIRADDVTDFTRSIMMTDPTSNEIRKVNIAKKTSWAVYRRWSHYRFDIDDVARAADELAYALKQPEAEETNTLEAAKSPAPVIKDLPSSRYLNAGFFSALEDSVLPFEHPLILDHRHYRLGVNIGQFWGSGAPGIPFPDTLLAPFFGEEPVLTLHVVVRSLDIEINQPHQLLSIPETGDSPIVFFNLSLNKPGRQAIDADILFHGHLLQSRRVEVFVIPHPGDPVPESAWPVQDSYITFTRTAFLNKNYLKPLADNPRCMTIVAERDLDNRIGLRFYDNTGTDLDFQQSNLSDVNMTKALDAVRGQLVKTMHAYTGTVGSSEQVLAKHLGQLAAIGRKFYMAMLPGLAKHGNNTDARQKPPLDLSHGTVIQVAPLSSQLGVPWELLYERKIESFQDGRITLCSSFRDHGPGTEDCPGFGDPTIVCPYGFWGYRYIIEQLPCYIDPHTHLPSHSLPMQIRNNIPIRFAAAVYSDFKNLDNHLNSLQSLAPDTLLNLTRADNREQVRKTLIEDDIPADILYFYTHGGQDAFGAPFLEIGSGDQIQLIDLDAWEINLAPRHPLVVLNACESADYSPDNFENLLKFFCDAGAAGVIGTQCEVREKLANAVMTRFFRDFLQQVPAGQALFNSRHVLLHEHLDPRGLAYSLFAAAEVQLAQPAI